MKQLLFDHNLSPRLVKRLADVYPNVAPQLGNHESVHVGLF